MIHTNYNVVFSNVFSNISCVATGAVYFAAVRREAGEEVPDLQPNALAPLLRDERSRLVWIEEEMEACAARGVELKWFGDDEPKAFTSRYDSWKYIEDIPHLPGTLAVLEKTLDMRVPLTFDMQDCNLIADIIEEEVRRLLP